MCLQSLSDEIASFVSPRTSTSLLFFLRSRRRSLRAFMRACGVAPASLLLAALPRLLPLLLLLASGWGAPYRRHLSHWPAYRWTLAMASHDHHSRMACLMQAPPGHYLETA